MKIKILEYKAYQGNQCKIQSHNFKKGKWKENSKFKEIKDLIESNPSRFLWHLEKTREVQL